MVCGFDEIAGYNAGRQVDSIAAALNKKYVSLAIGSPEGFALAEKAIQVENGRESAHLADVVDRVRLELELGLC